MFHQGPIPHPDILRGFDELVPGTAEKLINLAESESIHRREQESCAMKANIQAQKKQLEISEYQNRVVYESDKSGRNAGIIVSLGCIAATVGLSF